MVLRSKYVHISIFKYWWICRKITFKREKINAMNMLCLQDLRQCKDDVQRFNLGSWFVRKGKGKGVPHASTYWALYWTFLRQQMSPNLAPIPSLLLLEISICFCRTFFPELRRQRNSVSCLIIGLCV